MILETIAGRTASLKDGLIAVCAETCPSLSADLARAVRDFKVFPVTVFDAPEGRSLTPLPERYADAAERTKRAIAVYLKETK